MNLELNTDGTPCKLHHNLASVTDEGTYIPALARVLAADSLSLPYNAWLTTRDDVITAHAFVDTADPLTLTRVAADLQTAFSASLTRLWDLHKQLDILRTAYPVA